VPAIDENKDRFIRVGFIPLDDNGNVVHAHGGQIVNANGTYYWFGESDEGNLTDPAVNCYSS
jgi:hypothetical protein